MVAAIVHESRELSVGHGRARDGEGRQFMRMRPLFVVENVQRAGFRTQIVPAARHEDIFIADVIDQVRRRARLIGGKLRRRITHRLARVRNRLAVHIFVHGHKPVEIGFVRCGVALVELFEHAVEHLLHVGQRLIARRQRQLPAGIMRHRGRIPERIRVRPDGLQIAQVPQGPAFLKPRDVAQLPNQRIDDVHARHAHLLVGEIGHQRERALACVGEHGNQVG